MNADPHLVMLAIDKINMDVSEIKTHMSGLTDAVTKLAVIEERLLNFMRESTEVRDSIRAIESRMRRIESAAATNHQKTDSTYDWVKSIGLLIVGGGITYITTNVVKGIVG